MKLVRSVVICALAALSTAMQALAWGGTGHMIVGVIGYNDLSTATRSKVKNLLKSHPAYRKWMREQTSNDPVDLGRYLITRASRWPDDVRDPQGNTYGHADWHYINYPLVPPNYPNKPSLPGKDLILAQIRKNAAIVASKQPDSTRAIALSWLIHLIGDIHQPLHCATLVNEMFPTSDLGGNAFYVLLNGNAVKLHSLWDNLPTAFPYTPAGSAVNIAAARPRSVLPELMTATTPEAWSLEGRQYAIDNVYQYKGVALTASSTMSRAVSLPGGYLVDGRNLAKRCLALAGYRLADEINRAMN